MTVVVVVVVVGLILNSGISVVKPAKFTLETLSLFCSNFVNLFISIAGDDSKLGEVLVKP